MYVCVCVRFNIHFGGSEHHYRGRLNKRQQTAAAEAAAPSSPIIANLLHLRICTHTHKHTQREHRRETYRKYVFVNIANT